MLKTNEIKPLLDSLKNTLIEEGKFRLIVDGANVIYSNRSKGIKIRRIVAMLKYLSELPCEVFILVPSYFRRKFIKDERFKRLLNQGIIFFTPFGMDDDLFMLDFASVTNGFILSNDFFKEYQQQYPVVIRKRTVRFMIVERENDLQILVPALSQIRKRRGKLKN